MPTFRRTTLDLFNFDGALTLDLDAGVAAIDRTQVSFIWPRSSGNGCRAELTVRS